MPCCCNPTYRCCSQRDLDSERRAKLSSSAYSQLSLITIANVPDGDPLLWLPFAMIHIYLLYAGFVLWSNCKVGHRLVFHPAGLVWLEDECK